MVEDEARLREGLERRLKAQGFVVDLAEDGRVGEFAGLEYPIDLAIVDLGLPGRDGMELIRAWRAAGRSFPILVLTARDRWQDKVEALQAGADDYVTKPFNHEELDARLRALLRRSGGWSHSTLRSGTVELDTRSQAVKVDGRPVELTAFEYRLIEYLMLHAGEVISKAELADKLYHEDMERDSNVIEVFVGRLRRKLDPDGTARPIETLRGRGYRMSRD